MGCSTQNTAWCGTRWLQIGWGCLLCFSSITKSVSKTVSSRSSGQHGIVHLLPRLSRKSIFSETSCTGSFWAFFLLENGAYVLPPAKPCSEGKVCSQPFHSPGVLDLSGSHNPSSPASSEFLELWRQGPKNDLQPGLFFHLMFGCLFVRATRTCSTSDLLQYENIPRECFHFLRFLLKLKQNTIISRTVDKGET